MKIFELIKNNKKYKLVTIITIVLIIAIASIGIYAMNNNKPEFKLINNNVIKIEYGNNYTIKPIDLIDTSNYSENQIKDLKENIAVDNNIKIESEKSYPAIGNYLIKLVYDNKTLTKKLTVEDTTAPTITTEYSSIDIVQGTDLSTYYFQSLFIINDLSQYTFNADFSTIDSNTTGTYSLKAIALDNSNNKNEIELAINITPLPNENQELVTETVTNQDGTKSIRNTLKEKAVSKNLDTKNSSDKSTSNKKNSNNSSNSTNNSNQSFVANMSISKQCNQAIIVVGDGGSYATLSLHTKINGVWTQQLSCSARVGRNGITSNKREGDGKTPSGIYSFGQAFGTAGNPGTSRSWLQVNNNHYWVDDSNSPYYNKLVDASQTGIQWNSAEHLASYPTAYKYAIAVNYNTACTPNAGSAIFLHCSTGGSTAGCISVSQTNMIRILQSLQSDTLIGIYSNSNSLY